jgi:hypothetical protein
MENYAELLSKCYSELSVIALNESIESVVYQELKVTIQEIEELIREAVLVNEVK